MIKALSIVIGTIAILVLVFNQGVFAVSSSEVESRISRVMGDFKPSQRLFFESSIHCIFAAYEADFRIIEHKIDNTNNWHWYSSALAWSESVKNNSISKIKIDSALLFSKQCSSGNQFYDPYKDNIYGYVSEEYNSIIIVVPHLNRLLYLASG